MATVMWAVSAGEYSDYSVIATFERKADAERAVDAGLGENVEEMPHFAAGEQPVKVPYYEVWCELWPDREPEPVDPEAKYDWQHQNVRRPDRPEVKVTYHDEEYRNRVRSRYHPDPPHVTMWGQCTDRGLLAKAVQDRIARIRAEWAGVA